MRSPQELGRREQVPNSSFPTPPSRSSARRHSQATASRISCASATARSVTGPAISAWPVRLKSHDGQCRRAGHEPRGASPDNIESPGPLFDARRIHLADIDGSGNSDIIFQVTTNRMSLYFNQSGNFWSAAPASLPHFPRVDGSHLHRCDGTSSGNGTACLVWSSPLTHQT